ncbi:very long chain fatty acid elongase 6 [Helicoverpa armigera]|uniref:very long chain fatty acid elongase 6 n=1 Tax=Helicoverpa armigera TaxID=29058 RepID=UPI000B374A90|nr:elongation of very long chain fatty acids protein 6 [Helicoverpa armigera]XP_047019853.1 elongation of very long chain fatty acids protein 6 [Helicoverpa zea]
MESPVMAYAYDITPNYSYIFEFENEFIHTDYRKWMTENWTVAFYYVGVYMAFIFGGQYYMQNRPRFELRRTLMIWNCSLAAFSIMGACRTLPEFIHVLRNYGIYHSICVPSFIEQDKVSGFWTWMFVLSKLPELGDTVFIVLRKKPLIFLHWYHHITVLLYTWYSFTEYTSSARWFVVMNYCVHSVMYSYYALVSMGKYPPKMLAMTITVLQLTQMIVGCAINIWAHNYMATSAPTSCHISQINIKLSMAMYFSYFVLFAQFFYKAYLSPKTGKKAKTEPIPDVRDVPVTKKVINGYPRQRNGVVAH